MATAIEGNKVWRAIDGLQLACVQLPTSLGGVGGHCTHIDTANGVNAHRMSSIARSFNHHIARMMQQEQRQQEMSQVSSVQSNPPT